MKHTVYPRVCGGTDTLLDGVEYHEGLSPRVRGNRVMQLPTDIDQRSIPACAGEPTTVLSSVMASRVYPRVCGGTERVGDAPDGDMGLSPRVRGNQHLG